jgi:hypothetical protein
MDHLEIAGVFGSQTPALAWARQGFPGLDSFKAHQACERMGLKTKMGNKSIDLLPILT